MRIVLTQTEVARVLALERTDDVDPLVAAGVLDVVAHTRRGQALYDVQAVQRAARRLIAEREQP